MGAQNKRNQGLWIREEKKAVEFIRNWKKKSQENSDWHYPSNQNKGND